MQPDAVDLAITAYTKSATHHGHYRSVEPQTTVRRAPKQTQPSLDHIPEGNTHQTKPTPAEMPPPPFKKLDQKKTNFDTSRRTKPTSDQNTDINTHPTDRTHGNTDPSRFKKPDNPTSTNRTSFDTSKRTETPANESLGNTTNPTNPQSVNVPKTPLYQQTRIGAPKRTDTPLNITPANNLPRVNPTSVNMPLPPSRQPDKATSYRQTRLDTSNSDPLRQANKPKYILPEISRPSSLMQTRFGAADTKKKKSMSFEERYAYKGMQLEWAGSFAIRNFLLENIPALRATGTKEWLAEKSRELTVRLNKMSPESRTEKIHDFEHDICDRFERSKERRRMPSHLESVQLLGKRCRSMVQELLDDDNRELEKKIAHLESRNRELETLYNDTTDKHDALKAQSGDVGELKKENDELHGQIASVNQTLETLKREMETQEGRIVAAEDQKKALEESFEMERQRLQDTHSSLETATNEKLAKLQGDSDRITKKYKREKKKSKELEKSKKKAKPSKKLQTMYDDLKDANDELQSEYDDLQGATNDLKTEYNALKSNNEEFKGANNALQTKYDDLKGENDKIQTEYNTLKGANDNLKDAKDNLKDAKDNLKDANDALKDANDALQTKYNDLKGENDNLQTEYNDLKGANDTLQIKYDSLKDANETLQTTHQGLLDEHDRLQKQCTALEVTASGAQDSNDTLQKKYDQHQLYRSRNDELVEDIFWIRSDFESTEKTLVSRLGTSEATIVSLEAEVGTLKGQVQEYAEALERVKKKKREYLAGWGVAAREFRLTAQAYEVLHNEHFNPSSR